VVRVEIDDEDFLDAEVVDGVLRRQSDVVAKAEAVEFGGHGVVAGRSNQSYPVHKLACSKERFY